MRHHTAAWPHQVQAYKFASNRPASLLAAHMGTGKSKIAIDWLQNLPQHDRTLILCPLSVLSVWRREIDRHAIPGEFETLILDRGTTFDKFSKFCDRNKSDKRLIVVTNYDAAWRGYLGSRLQSRWWDAVILDESHRIKSPSGRAARWCAKLHATRRLCLTGTPMPHSPLDIWSQFRFLDPAIFGPSFVSFRARYAVTHPQFKSKVLRWINGDELREKIGRITLRIEGDVLTLPEVLHDTRTVQLSPKTAKAYRELEREFVTEINGQEITVFNALSKLLRLQQLSGGFLPGAETPEMIDPAKMHALRDLLEDVGPDEPVVVFCRFTAEVRAVQELAADLGRTTGEISGRVKDITDRGEMRPETQVIAVQIQAGGLGIDLTRARYAVYYSLGFSLGDYEQSLARVHRPGQTKPVTYYHLIAQGTVDEAVYRALRNRKDVVESILTELQGVAKHGTELHAAAE